MWRYITTRLNQADRTSPIGLPNMSPVCSFRSYRWGKSIFSPPISELGAEPRFLSDMGLSTDCLRDEIGRPTPHQRRDETPATGTCDLKVGGRSLISWDRYSDSSAVLHAHWVPSTLTPGIDRGKIRYLDGPCSRIGCALSRG